MSDLVIYRGKPVGAESLTKEQRDAVAYFFVRLKAIDPTEFDRIMPDEKTERLVKREYASSLVGLTKKQMDEGFAEFHHRRQDNDQDFKFINIDRVIGLMYESDPNCKAHKYFAPCLPEPKEIKEARKARGREHCSRLRSILDE